MKKNIVFYFLLYGMTFVFSCQVRPDQRYEQMSPFPTQDNLSLSKQVVFLNQNQTENLTEEQEEALRYRRAHLSLKNQDLAQAFKDALWLFKLDSAVNAYRALYAQVLYAKEDYAKAFEVGKPLFSVSWFDLSFSFTWARILAKNKQYRKSNQVFDDIEQYFSKKDEIYFYKGLNFMGMNDTLQGVTLIKRAIEISPSTVEYYPVLLNYYWNKKNVKQVYKLMGAALDKKIPNSEVYLFSAKYYEYYNWTDSAYYYYASLFDFDPLNNDAFYDFCIQQTYFGSAYLAQNGLTKLVNKYPGNALYNYQLAMLYEQRIKNYTKAKQYFQSALFIEPDNETYTIAMRRIDYKIYQRDQFGFYGADSSRYQNNFQSRDSL